MGFEIENGILKMYYPEAGVTDVIIPEGVTSIGSCAFERFIQLTSITIPEGVMSIGKSAFLGCTGLTSITIPKGVTSIGAYAFRCCTGLLNITIPNSVTNIGISALYGCRGLNSIIVEKDNPKYYSIGNCLIEKETKKLIVGCDNSIIPVDDSVTIISGSAFHGCSGLSSIIIPNNIIKIGESAFEGCSGLTRINVEEGNPKYYSINNCLIEKETKTLIAGCKNSIIPTDESVTSIGEGAFYDCSDLASITIPESVTSIGVSAFGGCRGLKCINILGNPNLISDNFFAKPFGDIDGLFVCFTKKYSDTMEFARNYKRTGIVCPNYNLEKEENKNIKEALVRGFIEKSEEYQDEDIRLRYLNYIVEYNEYCLPLVYAKDRYEIIKAIAEEGMINSDNYEDFWAPVAETEAVECKVFLLNWKAKNITPEMEEEKLERELNKEPYNEKDMRKVWKYETKEDGTIKLTGYKKKSANSVIVPDHIGKKDVTEIGENTFNRCEQITDIIIPEGVKSIGKRAFEDCRGLTSITIPKTVTSIGERVFLGCSKLYIFIEEGNPKYYVEDNSIIEKDTNLVIFNTEELFGLDW